CVPRAGLACCPRAAGAVAAAFGVAAAAVVVWAVTGVAAVSAGLAGAALAAGGAMIALIGRNLKFHSAAGASKATPTSLESLAKPSISTSIVQAPSARSLNEYRPFSSVVVNSFLSPLIAVTDAPGTGRPPNLTVPWCSAAIRPATVMQTAKNRPR